VLPSERALQQPKDFSAADLAALLTGMPVRQIIDQWRLELTSPL
jgi:hypothetical protein